MEVAGFYKTCEPRSFIKATLKQAFKVSKKKKAEHIGTQVSRPEAVFWMDVNGGEG